MNRKTIVSRPRRVSYVRSADILPADNAPPPAPLAPPLVVTRQEAAALLRLGLTKLDQLISAGTLKAVKIGRSTVIPYSDLKDFVASQPVRPVRGRGG